MSQIPRISIVIPTFNRAQLLQQAVESALAQAGFDAFDILVADDCSDDETASYLSGVRHDKLRTIRSDRRLGMGVNWNRAVRLSTGDFVYVLQDDDLAMPNLVARAVQVLDTHRNVDLVCFANCLIDSEGGNRRLHWQYPREEFWPAPQALMYFANYWTVSSTQVIFSRRVFDHYGGFDLTPPIMSDAEAILRWMTQANTVVVPDILALRRVWSGSVTSATSETAEMGRTMMFLKSRVLAQAQLSQNLTLDQMRELEQSLQRSFIEPYPACNQ
jgi:glycosyltransferase involved in cell wall biosynthesis